MCIPAFSVPWIRDTVFANGGLSSFDLSLIADPIVGNKMSKRS